MLGVVPLNLALTAALLNPYVSSQVGFLKRLRGRHNFSSMGQRFKVSWISISNCNFQHIENVSNCLVTDRVAQLPSDYVNKLKDYTRSVFISLKHPEKS